MRETSLNHTALALTNNSIGVFYEPLVSESAIEKANRQNAIQTLSDLKNNMMKQSVDLQKQNLPPEEMLKRLFQQNNIPSSMFQNLLKQQGEGAKPAAGAKTPAKPR